MTTIFGWWKSCPCPHSEGVRDWNKAETTAELHGIWEGRHTTIGLRQGLSTEALRFAATLKSSNQRSKALGEEEAVESLVKQCGRDPVKTIAASRWVLRVTQGVEELLAVAHRSRAVTRIAHARLLAVAIGLTKFSDPEKATLYVTWEKQRAACLDDLS
jgi:hypothetical protein